MGRQVTSFIIATDNTVDGVPYIELSVVGDFLSVVCS